MGDSPGDRASQASLTASIDDQGFRPTRDHDSLVDLQESAGRHSQYLGDVEESFVQKASTSVLDLDQDVSRDARLECEGFLGEASLQSEGSNRQSHVRPVPGPGVDPSGVILAWSRRHPSSTGQWCRKVCPTSSASVVLRMESLDAAHVQIDRLSGSGRSSTVHWRLPCAGMRCCPRARFVEIRGRRGCAG